MSDFTKATHFQNTFNEPACGAKARGLRLDPRASFTSCERCTKTKEYKVAKDAVLRRMEQKQTAQQMVFLLEGIVKRIEAGDTISADCDLVKNQIKPVIRRAIKCGL